MSESLVIPDSFFPKIRLKHLLLDTSFFIDASFHQEAFFDFYNECRKNEVTLVTISPVALEFTKGSKSKEVISNSLLLMEKFVDAYLPVHPSVFEKYSPFLVEEYQKKGAGVSITDLLLGGMVYHHKKDLCLLTKNSKDFPLNVFDLETYFLLKNKISSTIQIYGVYCCKEKTLE